METLETGCELAWGVALEVELGVESSPPSGLEAARHRLLRAEIMPRRRREAMADSFEANSLTGCVAGNVGSAAIAEAKESSEDCSRVPALPMGIMTRSTAPHLCSSSVRRAA